MHRKHEQFLLCCLILVSTCFLWGCGDENPTTPEDDDTGTIMIATSPDSIAAPWSLAGPAGYSHAGSGDETLNELAPGEYSVTWTDVTGWITPANSTRTLGADATVTFSGTYLYSIPVTLTPERQFEIMAAAGEAYINDSVDCPGVIRASDLLADLNNFTVIDIRNQEAYDAGHIEGAYHSSLGSLLGDLGDGTIPTDRDIVIAGYTGQSAGHAKIALEMLYDWIEIKSLLWGMSSWHPQLADPWNYNIGDNLTIFSTASENGNLVDAGGFPTFDTGATNEADVVPARVAEMLSNGFRGKKYSDIADDIDAGDYFVINYFDSANYFGQGSYGVPGHIEGAFQYTPYMSLGKEQMLKYLPTDMPIVTYCWTGQHSSQVTAYLNLLGYEAYSLKFGSNNLFHTELLSHVWSEAQIQEYGLESTVTEPFEAVAEVAGDYINSGNLPGLITALDLFDDLENYTVVDIRTWDDYVDGHIPGAFHSSLDSLLHHIDSGAIPVDMNIVFASYTGQTAGHAKIALDLLYNDIEIKSLKWGMASWHFSLTGPWDYNIANNLNIIETTNQNGNLRRHPFPTLATYDAATVLEERVAEMLQDGFMGKVYTDLIDGMADEIDDYFIINYFDEADYEGDNPASGVPGHIPGAYQFTPYTSLDYEQMLANVPTDMPILVYCWTGQSSSQLTAYLNILGYEAYSLKFGSNNLFYSDLLVHKWDASTQTHNLTLE